MPQAPGGICHGIAASEIPIPEECKLRDTFFRFQLAESHLMEQRAKARVGTERIE